MKEENLLGLGQVKQKQKLEKQRLEKTKIIQEFIESNIDAAVQGSKKWLDDRRYIIGGSEISTIIGCNAFSTLEGLVAQKVNLSSFNGSTATRWGNLFENVSELLFSHIFVKDDKIYNTGSIQHKSIKNHRYSPDGLCAVLFNIMQNLSYKIVLLEFKSPFGSVPTSKVPKHYIPQVKAGLCTIDIAETSVFVNNMFRKCTLKQLNFDINYDNTYHRDTELKLKGIEYAIANGIILFSISKQNLAIFERKFKNLVDYSYDSDDSCSDDVHIRNDFIAEPMSDSDSDSDSTDNFVDDGSNILYKIKKIVDFSENKLENMIDFGNENKALFDQFLTLYKQDGEESFIDIKCVKPQINRSALNKNSKTFILPDELRYIGEEPYISDICKKYNFEKIITKYIDRCHKNDAIPIGYLPWKLMRSSHIIVEREASFLDDIKDKINNAVNIINDIVTNSSTADDTADNLEKHFTDNEFTKKYYENKSKSPDYFNDFL